MSDSCDPMDRSPPGSSVHGNSPGKNTRVGCHFLHPFEHSNIDLTSKLNFTHDIISGFKFCKALPNIFLVKNISIKHLPLNFFALMFIKACALRTIA